MENRFQEMNRYFTRGRSQGLGGLGSGVSGAPALAESFAWARPLSAEQRVLVILIENGGIDLQIPRFVDALIDAIPGSSLIPDSARKVIRELVAEKINEPIRKASKDLLEGVELLGNRYAAAKPGLYGDVVILMDGSASYEALKKQLIDQSRTGKIIDLFVLTHGSNNHIAVRGGITGERIRAIRAEYGKPLSIRSVYMMSCVGSSLNQPWRDIGAQVVSGTRGNNYLPEPTMYFFWSNWKAGNGFEAAVTQAYQQTVALINEALRSLLGSLALPVIDVRNLQAVKDSEPVISGQGSIAIGSDDIVFSKSLDTESRNDESLGAWLRSLSENDSGGGATTVSPQGLDFLRRFEQPSAADISADEARGRLKNELAAVTSAILGIAPRPLTANQLDALASFVHDIGTAAFQRSRVARLFADGNFSQVPDEMRKWTKARVGGEVVDLPGLVQRRSAEADLWRQAPIAYAKDKDPPAPVAKVVDPFPGPHAGKLIPAAASLKSCIDTASQVANVKDLCTGVIDLTGVSSTDLPYVGHNDTDLLYVGSVAKFYPFLAAFELRQRVTDQAKAMIAAGLNVSKKDWQKNVFNALTSAWQPQLDAKFPKLPKGTHPDFDSIVDIARDGTATFKKSFTDAIKRATHNNDEDAAGRYIRALSYPYINGTLAAAGFFDTASQTGLWISGDYNGHDWLPRDGAGLTLTTRWQDSKHKVSNFVGTASQLARFLGLLTLGKLVPSASAAEMLDLLGTPWLEGILAGASPPRGFSSVHGKVGIGTWDGLHHDTGILTWERTTADPTRTIRYVVVVLGSDSRNVQMRQLEIAYHDCVVAQHP